MLDVIISRKYQTLHVTWRRKICQNSNNADYRLLCKREQLDKENCQSKDGRQNEKERCCKSCKIDKSGVKLSDHMVRLKYEILRIKAEKTKQDVAGNEEDHTYDERIAWGETTPMMRGLPGERPHL